MNELEKKLSAYRAEEKRKRQIERFKNIILKPVKFYREKTFDSFAVDEKEEALTEFSDNQIQVELFDGTNTDAIVENEKETEEEEPFSWKKFLMSAFVWCCFFRYAVYIEFGMVFLILSGFYFIWTNTRTSPKKLNEMSAYSVFNPNCERIDGTLDAEQFEQEIRHGLIM